MEFFKSFINCNRIKKKVAKTYFLTYKQLNFSLEMLVCRQLVKFFKIW